MHNTCLTRGSVWNRGKSHRSSVGAIAGILALAAGYPAHAASPRYPLTGRSVEIDPSFPYYADRSAESIASEMHVHGIRAARVVVTDEDSISRKLIDALHHDGIGVWCVAFGNGTYAPRKLPAEASTWKMVLRRDLEGKPFDDGFTRLCLNNLDYRQWKKRRLAALLCRVPFDGVEIVEAHWPEYPGPSSPVYGCFCPACRAAFLTMFPQETELPNVVDPQSPRSPKHDPQLWNKWLKFRATTATAFLNDIVNGPGGIRSTSHTVSVGVWTLTLTDADGMSRMRDDCGQDPAAVARLVRPDSMGLQTNWPDWSRPDLTPDYVDGLKPFIDAIRAVAPSMPLVVQADAGSARPSLRSAEWIAAFERRCRQIGAAGTTYYSYEVSGPMYDAPRLVSANRYPGAMATALGRHVALDQQSAKSIRLTFDKRIEPSTDPSHFQLDHGRVDQVTVDGNLVTLSTTDAAHASTVTVTDIANVPRLLFFSDIPAAILRRQSIQIMGVAK